MQLAGEGGGSREGVRMGLWGAAQAVAFGLGGLLGTGASDLARLIFASPGAAYSSVFALEGLMFVVAAVLAAGHAHQPAKGAVGRAETAASRHDAQHRGPAVGGPHAA
jgi:BCD family chlorophyll transporter-like MFS transporter